MRLPGRMGQSSDTLIERRLFALNIVIIGRGGYHQRRNLRELSHHVVEKQTVHHRSVPGSPAYDFAPGRSSGRIENTRDQNNFIRWFIRQYGVNMEAARESVEQYENFNDFFTRAETWCSAQRPSRPIDQSGRRRGFRGRQDRIRSPDSGWATAIV